MLIKKKTAVSHVLSILLSVLLIASLSAGFAYIGVLKSFNAKSIVKTFDSVDVTDLKIDGKAIDKYIYDEIKEEMYFRKGEISSSDIEIILENEDVKEYLAKVVGDVTEYIINDKGKAEIDPDDIVELIEDNRNKLVKAGVEEKTLDALIREVGATDTDTIDLTKRIDSDSDDIDDIRDILNTKYKNIIITVIAVLVVLILIANFRGIKDAFLYFAIDAVASGFIIKALVVILKKLLEEELEGSEYKDMKDIVTKFMNQIIDSIGSMAIYLFIAGGGCLVIFIIMCIIKNRTPKVVSFTGSYGSSVAPADYLNRTSDVMANQGYVAPNSNINNYMNSYNNMNDNYANQSYGNVNNSFTNQGNNMNNSFINQSNNNINNSFADQNYNNMNNGFVNQNYSNTNNDFINQYNNNGYEDDNELTARIDNNNM